MAKVILANASSTETVLLDSDRGDRENRYTQWTITGGDTLAIDEGDIILPFDDTIPKALDSGIVTTTEANLNDIVDLKTKNFVAGGLGIHYYESNGVLEGNRAVVVDGTNGKIGYVSASGGTVTGILRADTTDGQYERVMVKEGKTVTVELGGTVAEGDYLASDTTGRAITTVTAGNFSFAVATGAGVEAGTQDVVLAFHTLA